MGVVSSVNSRGETTSLLEVERTEELQALHEQVMQEMTPFFRYEVSEAMIHDDVVTATTLEWIRTYPQKASYEHFRPHITLGYGQVPPGLSLPDPVRRHAAGAVPSRQPLHLPEDSGGDRTSNVRIGIME